MSNPTLYRTVAGRPITMPALPPHLQNHNAVKTANLVLDQVDALHTLRQEVNNDAMLSPRGKASQLAKPIANMLKSVAAGAGINLDNRKSLDIREAKMLAVPPIAPSDAAAAAVDVEIRQWWRAMPANERMDMIRKFNESPDHQRIEAALLRSPVALADPELLAIREGWNRQARIENDAEDVAIDRDRTALDWSDTAIAHAEGCALSMSDMSKADLLRTVVTGNNPMADGAHVFGFRQDEIDAAKRGAMLDEAA